MSEATFMDAATVVLLRDGDTGLETLLLRRDSRIVFAGGHWVFPGGRVDEGDRAAGADELQAARHAAVRETLEEAGLAIDAAGLVPFSHWTPPPIAPRRYLTWFFLAKAPPGAAVRIDEHEIREHAWMRPADALDRRNRGEIELSPPTWVTLDQLARHAVAADALEAARRTEPERFSTRIATADGGAVALWHGDAGYDTSDAAPAGPRHRLWMLADGWRYERT